VRGATRPQRAKGRPYRDQGAWRGVGIAADFWHAKGCDKGRDKGRGVLKSGLSAAILWATSSANYRRGRTCVVGALMIDGQ
jgi:hypothetical protein